MNIEFESDYRNKILFQNFKEETHINTYKDVLQWRSQWTKALSSWHSPYKTLVNCSNLHAASDKEIGDKFSTMMKFFEGLFLKKIIGYGYSEGQGHKNLPFEIFKTEEEASKALGIRQRSQAEPGDFRSSIQFENHFRQHVIELTFSQPVTINSKKQVLALKSKLTNNLMHWHSGWNLLIDCNNVEFSEEVTEDFEKIITFFKGFFMKEVIGYLPKSLDLKYPFKVYRSRHKAAAILENEGMNSGEDANCASRK